MTLKTLNLYDVVLNINVYGMNFFISIGKLFVQEIMFL